MTRPTRVTVAFLTAVMLSTAASAQVPEKVLLANQLARFM